jgi:Protein of unknown function (DUF1320).
MYTTGERILRTSRLNDASSLSTLQIEDVIGQAKNRIHSRLGKRYKVPFALPFPDVVGTIADWLAAGYLLERFYSDRKRDKEEEGLSEILIRRAEDWLDEILEDHLLDGLLGVMLGGGDSSGRISQAMAATKPSQVSAMEDALEKWDGL